jgi:hypothetical protein
VLDDLERQELRRVAAELHASADRLAAEHPDSRTAAWCRRQALTIEVAAWPRDYNRRPVLRLVGAD